MDLFGQELAGEELRRRVGHLSQVGGVRLLTSDNGPSRGVRLARVPHRHRLHLRDRRRARLRRRPRRLPRRLARLDAADADAGPVVFRGPGGLRLAARRARRLQQHLRPASTSAIRRRRRSRTTISRPGRPTATASTTAAALIPAELVSFGERWEGGRCILEAVGRVTQAQTYGENLVMTRTYRAELGASWFTMEDVVENRGFLPTEHMLLYHINVGYPFVDEGSELIAPVAGPPRPSVRRRPTSTTARAGRASSRRRRTGCSRPSSTRCVPDADGQVEVAIFNPRLFGGTGAQRPLRSRAMPQLHRVADDGRGAVRRRHRALHQRLRPTEGQGGRRTHCPEPG